MWEFSSFQAHIRVQPWEIIVFLRIHYQTNLDLSCPAQRAVNFPSVVHCWISHVLSVPQNRLIWVFEISETEKTHSSQKTTDLGKQIQTTCGPCMIEERELIDPSIGVVTDVLLSCCTKTSKLRFLRRSVWNISQAQNLQLLLSATLTDAGGTRNCQLAPSSLNLAAYINQIVFRTFFRSLKFSTHLKIMVRAEQVF